MTSPLFTSVQIGGRQAPHRVVMAPMTRARSAQPGDVPNAMNARYYAQRASAALIVSEATQVSPQGKGYSFTPGIYSPEQVAGWRLVTQAVHAKGGRIFAQLWHVGRMSHPDFHNGELPVAPSALAFEGKIWKVDPVTGRGEMVDSPTRERWTETRSEASSLTSDALRGTRSTRGSTAWRSTAPTAISSTNSCAPPPTCVPTSTAAPERTACGFSRSSLLPSRSKSERIGRPSDWHRF
jgi:N-ethylmaleimide reductase